MNDPPHHDAPARLYTDLAPWWPWISSPNDYEEEAAFFAQSLVQESTRPVRRVLELGCGGGNNASFLSERFEMTLTDVSPGMLEVSRELNPNCEHVRSDMRTLRLGRQFDAVFVHDAVSYMTTEADVRAALETAFVHCAPGAAALFAPDAVRETFVPGTHQGGHDSGDRGARFLEWSHIPSRDSSYYIVDYAFLLRTADGFVHHHSDRHRCGLFSIEQWLRWLENTGFQARKLRFEHSEFGDEDHWVFVGRVPDR